MATDKHETPQQYLARNAINIAKKVELWSPYHLETSISIGSGIMGDEGIYQRVSLIYSGKIVGKSQHTYTVFFQPETSNNLSKIISSGRHIIRVCLNPLSDASLYCDGFYHVTNELQELYDCVWNQNEERVNQYLKEIMEVRKSSWDSVEEKTLADLL